MNPIHVRYAQRDDLDDSDMEADVRSIQREEARRYGVYSRCNICLMRYILIIFVLNSTRIARKEDEEEEELERQREMRKKARR